MSWFDQISRVCRLTVASTVYAGAWNVSRLVVEPSPKTGVDGKPCGRICCLKGRAASENWS